MGGKPRNQSGHPPTPSFKLKESCSISVLSVPTWNSLRRNCVRAGRTRLRSWAIFARSTRTAAGSAPAALLGDFRALDQNRREAITTAERLKARRNELSQQVGALKKSGQDATALMR